MSEAKRILIIGNGPSTRDLVDWGLERLPADVDTFGMGAAYRFFRQAGWWPTYYAIGDSKVVFSHREELAKIVQDPGVTTERFYLSWPVCEHPRLERIDHGTTGHFCFKQALALGYTQLYLIGIEGHYVEKILESRSMSDDDYLRLGFDELKLAPSLRETLRIITRTPEDNPNFFFQGYQQAGDVYSLPRAKKHRELWSDITDLAESKGASVVNLSQVSRVVDFPRATIASVFDGGAEVEEAPLPTPDAGSDDGSAAFWYGPFEREREKRVAEASIVLDLFDSGELRAAERPVMVDVGAARGSALRGFVKRGWTVHAFEPNPALFEELCGELAGPNVIVNDLAVTDVGGEERPFYTSVESHGIGTLEPFRLTHEATATVRTVRLGDYLGEAGIEHVDFLKIDAEGFDLMVLKGVDLASVAVQVILCEFEDRKTAPLGYSTHDLARHLESAGYAVYVSEWHPIVRYGVPHQWRMLKRYPCELEDAEAWGNLLAFKSDPGIWALTDAVNRSMRRHDKTPKPIRDADKALRAAKERIKKLESRLSGVTGSTSWRITAPLRLAADLVRWILGRPTRTLGRSKLARLGGSSSRLSSILRQAVFAVGFITIFAGAVVVYYSRPSPGVAFGVALGALLLAGATPLLMRSRLRRVYSYFGSRLGRETAARKKLEAKIERETAARKKLRAKIEREMAAGKELEAKIEREMAAGKELEAKIDRDVTTRLEQVQRAVLWGSHGPTHLHLTSRLLEPGDEKELSGHWAERLGLELGSKELSYLAHRVRTIESNGIGRLAAPIQTALVRILCARSLPGKEVSVLEIGTLFGLGAACVYDGTRGFFERLRLTLIDPLSGYYGDGAPDPVTGAMPVPEAVQTNLAMVGSDPEAVRLIRKSSTDENVRRSLEGDRFDLLVIDGDHSAEGVSSDFRWYGPLVAPGGLIVFDDYGNAPWPDVQRVVDSEVMARGELELVASGFNTAVFRVAEPLPSAE